MTGASTEKAMAVTQLQKVFDAANQVGSATILITLAGKSVFPDKRVFDFVSIAIRDSTKSDHLLLLTARCRSLTVVKETKVKAGDDWFEAVTLELSGDDKFTTEIPAR
jgi:hypothetical protein